ncbi:condensation domain-containing protein [Streptomyces sp. NPDC089799]|uniref:condensation domain-containing protein n=1 Tax=Streptomyces sp. NPDC089799 TaxID=3155066 RepID=UPI0034399D74
MTLSGRDSDEIIRRILARNERAFEGDRIVRQSRRTGVPASAAQRRIWFLHQLDGDTPSYNTPLMVRLEGKLCRDALRQALNAVIDRHEGLRTTFATVDDEVVQVIAPRLEIALPYVDLSGIPASEREAELQKQVEAEANRPFSLESEPLVRAAVWGLTPSETCLLINIHHIVSDGWSEDIFLKELGDLYSSHSVESEGCGTAPRGAKDEDSLGYLDFAVWESERMRSGAYESQLSYWSSELSSLPGELVLPFDRSRQAGGSTRLGGWVDVDVPPQLPARLLEWRAHTSTFDVLTAAFAAMLHRWSGADDIVIGTPLANRARPEWESVVGLFVNTAAIRLSVSAADTLSEVLAQVKEKTVQALARQEAPFDQVVDLLGVDRRASVNPVYQVMCTVNRAPAKPVLRGLEITELQELRTRTAKFDLELKSSHWDGGLRVWFEYPASLFDRSTVEGLARDYSAALSAILSPTQVSVGELRATHRRPVSMSGEHLSSVPESVSSAAEADPETLARLLSLWHEVLGNIPIDRTSHFFDSGGNSLLATRLVLRVRREWDIEPTVSVVFDKPVLSDLAAHIDVLVREAGEEAASIEAEIAELSEEELDLLLAADDL